MNEKFSISIDNTCSENFNNFVSTDKGGYCTSCKKTVIDFTKMSDQEIINYFDTSKKNTCGFFLESQLKTYATVNPLMGKEKPNKFISSVFGFSLLSILSFNTGYSQEKIKGNEIVKIEKNSEEATDSLDLDNPHIVRGTVSDSNGPLPGASVYLKKKKIGVQTDRDGKFTFPKPLKRGDILVVSFIGLDDQEIKVTKKDMNVKMAYDIKLQPYKFVMMGEVVTNKVYKSKPTFFQKLKSLFTNE